jgi:hypothetical protein
MHQLNHFLYTVKLTEPESHEILTNISQNLLK